MTDLPFHRKLNIKFLSCLMAALLVFAGLAYLLHGFQVRRNASTLLELADRSDKESDYAKSADYLKRYLQLSPHDADVRARYALLLADEKKLGTTDQALARAFNPLEDALRLSPERHDLRRRVIDIAMRLKSYSNAAQHLDRLQQAFPDNATLEGQRARCYEANGEYKNARKAYEKAIAHAPLVAQHYADLAYLLRKHPREVILKERDPDVVVLLANNKIDEMVRVNAHSYEARLLRVYYKKDFNPSLDPAQMIKATEEDIRKAQELAPDAADVLLIVANLEQEKNAPQKARASLQRGIQFYPDDWRMYRALARLEDDEGHLDAAVECLQSGLKRLPNDVNLLWNTSLLLIKSNRGAETDDLVKRLRAAGRPETDLDYINACKLFQQGKWRDTIRIMQRVYPPLMDRHTRHPDWFALDYSLKASLMIGYSYEQLGDAERAAAAFNRVVLRDPRSKAAHRELARMQWALGRLDAAVEEYRQLLALPAAPAEALTELAQVLILRNLQKNLSDWTAVNQVLDAAEKLTPRPVELPLLRAEVLIAQKQFRQASQVLVQGNADKKIRPAEIWAGMATLEQKQGNAEAALALLNDAESYVGDHVLLRLARARYWVERQTLEKAGALTPGTPAAKALAALSSDLEKFKPEDKQRLVRGLAAAYRQLGASHEAELLWDLLAKKQVTDLASRLSLFDLALEDMALQGRDDGRMKRYIEEIHDIEGDEGTLWRYCCACQIVQVEAGPLEKVTPAARHERLRKDPRIKQHLKAASDLLDSVASQRSAWPRVSACQGQIQDLLGNTEAAIAKYQQAVVLGERDPSVIRRVVEMLSAQQRYPEADQMLQRLAEQTPTFAGLERVAAEVVLAYRHDVPAAVKLAEKAISAQSKEFRDYLWLGQILWAARQPAESPFRRAVTLAPQEPTAWVAYVNYLVHTGEKTKAETVLEEAKGSLPRDKAPLALARCYTVLRKNDLAGKLYREALEMKPNDPETLRSVAVYHLSQNHVKEAQRYLDQIIQQKFDDPGLVRWARNLSALVMNATGDFQQKQQALALLGILDHVDAAAIPAQGGAEDERTRAQVLAQQPGLRPRQEAIKILQKLRQGQRASSSDRMLLALLYDACGEWPKARDEMGSLASAEEEQIHKASPELNRELQGAYAEHLGQFAYRLLAHDETNQAQACLEKLEKLQPDAFGTLALKARILARSGRANEIAADIIARTPGKAQLLEPAAALLEEIGQTAAAEEMYQRYVDHEKKPEAILIKARFYGRQNLPAKALALCEEARKDCPPEAVCLAAALVLATSKPSKEQCQLVAGWLEQAIAKTPTNKRLLDELAIVRSRQDDYAGMIQLYRDILKQDPADAKALNNLAWLLALKEGNTSEAMKSIQKAIDLDGPVANRLSTRAVVYLTMGQGQAALKDLDEVLATNPSAVIYFRKARALHQAKQDEAARRYLTRAMELGLNEASLDPLERPTYGRLRRDLGVH